MRATNSRGRARAARQTLRGAPVALLRAEPPKPNSASGSSGAMVRTWSYRARGGGVPALFQPGGAIEQSAGPTHRRAVALRQCPPAAPAPKPAWARACRRDRARRDRRNRRRGRRRCDLRDRAPTCLLHHFGAARGLEIDADLADVLDAARAQQLLGAHAIRAHRGGIHRDLHHGRCDRISFFPPACPRPTTRAGHR